MERDQLESGSNRATVRRAAASFRPYTWQVIGVVLLILVTASLGVVNPVLIRSVFDDALFPPGGIDMRMLWVLSSIMIAATVVSGGLGILQTYLTNEVGQSVMRDRLYSHLWCSGIVHSFPPTRQNTHLTTAIICNPGGRLPTENLLEKSE